MLTGKRILLMIGDAPGASAAPEAIRHLRAAGAEVIPFPLPGALVYVTPAALAERAARAVVEGPQGVDADLTLGFAVGPALADLAPERGPRLIVGAPGSDLPELADLAELCIAALAADEGPLAGRHVLVTSGPTHEPIDPVRYIANRSSGAQGTAIARALVAQGAQVTFVTGPAAVPPPTGVRLVRVETAIQMRDAVEAALPADAAVFAAAVADWRVAQAATSKMKKDGSGRLPQLSFTENPDILAAVAQRSVGRPRLVIGFAAETDDVLAHATAKRLRKGCDWIVANDVSPGTGIMGGRENAVTLITAAGAETWPRMGKDQVAERLATRIAEALR
ncbi:phosphopantothenoylcysteine decarboxylase [Halodurantibacterium flavum]|uniref:Phosphopantothenoylcysteine decarboxylase n=1 Tax=Halodurantibacterium flavum TaxID=1382802 RepID=A0ABW4S8G9_9RHOB